MHEMAGNWHSAYDWLWMTLMILLWIAVVGSVVYAAVRLAMHHERRPPLHR